MSALAALLAVFLAQDSEDCTLAYLRYLARHPMKDGSWGGRPLTCTCPEPPAPPPKAPDPETITELIRRLGDEDPDRRDEAERELATMGEGALPALQKARDHTDLEVRGRCARITARIAEQGRGAGDVETTGLALLAFLGAGYSHLSKDTYEGICFGELIRNGLQWLMSRQGPSGRFDGYDAVADAVATLALSEAYGLTASGRFQAAAQKGVTAVENADVRETRALVWKGMVVASAEISGLQGPHAEQAAAVVEALGKQPSLPARAARAFLRSSLLKLKDERPDEIAKVGPKGLDPETRHLATIALFAQEGFRGERWKAWSPLLKDCILPRQVTQKDRCERGSWEGEGLRGRLRTTAFNGMSLQVTYRYEHFHGATK